LVAFFTPLIILALTASILFKSENENPVPKKNISKEKFSQCLYLNLFISYFQHLFLFRDFLAVPEAFQYFINIVANPSFMAFGYFSCFLTNPTHFNLFGIYILVLLTKFLVLLILLMRLNSSKKFPPMRILFGAILFFFLEAPGSLSFLIGLFDCFEIGNWSYSKFYSALECQGHAFLHVKSFLLSPLLPIITIFLPLLFTFVLLRGGDEAVDQHLLERINVVVFGKSNLYIERSNRNWLSFYFVAFGKLIVFFLIHSEQKSSFKFVIIAFYLVFLILFNKERKINFLYDWKKHFLMIDSTILLVNIIIGCGVQLLNDGIFRVSLEYLVWIGSFGYIVRFYLFNAFMGKRREYEKLEENNIEEYGENNILT